MLLICCNAQKSVHCTTTFQIDVFKLGEFLKSNIFIKRMISKLFTGRSTKENTGKYFTTEVCNSTDNCSLPINATTTEFTNCSSQQETLCRNEELLFRDFFRSLLRDKLKSVRNLLFNTSIYLIFLFLDPSV